MSTNKAARAGLIGMGIMALVGVGLWGAADSVTRKFCKPVVPHIVVDLSDAGTPLNEASLFLTYAENASERDEKNGRYKSVRFTDCFTHRPTCRAPRKRQEMRFEGPRKQSIEVRGMGIYRRDGTAIHGNFLIGEVKWDGPSYPSRVVISCDIAKADGKNACRIKRIVENPITDGSENDTFLNGRSRHDQCRPDSLSIASLLR